MPVVLDCSAAMSWYFKNVRKEIADAYLREAASQRVNVPALWPLEILHVVTRTERGGVAKPAAALEFIALLDKLSIDVEPALQRSDWQRILELSRRNQLTVYDTTYLDVALRANATLISRDNALVQAAKRAGVDVFEPHDETALNNE